MLFQSPVGWVGFSQVCSLAPFLCVCVCVCSDAAAGASSDETEGGQPYCSGSHRLQEEEEARLCSLSCWSRCKAVGFLLTLAWDLKSQGPNLTLVLPKTNESHFLLTFAMWGV